MHVPVHVKAFNSFTSAIVANENHRTGNARRKCSSEHAQEQVCIFEPTRKWYFSVLYNSLTKQFNYIAGPRKLMKTKVLNTASA